MTETARNKTFLDAPHFPVIWEEVARDGAQAKTLLNASQRIELAQNMGTMFGQYGTESLIFAAGFPSSSKMEYEIIRQMVDSIDTCSLATHGRATKEDIKIGTRALSGCAHGHLTFFFPVSLGFCRPMGFKTPKQALKHGLEMLDFALELADDEGLSIDVALADAGRAEPAFVAEAAQALFESGADIVKICDSVGSLLPHQMGKLIQEVRRVIPSDAQLGIHQHNDFGLALAGTLEGMRGGANVLSSSWLGLAERSGLPATEQLLVILQLRLDELLENNTYAIKKWAPSIDLKQVPKLAKKVSDYLDISIRSVDPIIGSGINSISTGTPFSDPKRFHPFDPEAILGISQEIYATHLAGNKVVDALAKQLGFDLSKQELELVREWIKIEAYSRNQSVIPKEDLLLYLRELTLVTSEP